MAEIRSMNNCGEDGHDIDAPTLQRLDGGLLQGQANTRSSHSLGRSLYQRLKRVGDVAFAVMALPIAAAVSLPVALAIYQDMGRPVLFRQRRVGRNEVPICIFKFRTMTTAVDGEGRLLSDDLRVTGLGKILRSWSLDEIPQIVNVIRGDMSLVGPRPLPEEYLPFFHDHERIRHDVRPGITGLAQVMGRNALSWERRLGLDADYVQSMGLRLDVEILFLTLARVMSRHGVAVVPALTGKRLDVERGAVGD